MGEGFADTNETPIAKPGEYDLLIKQYEITDKNGKQNIQCDVVFEGEDYMPFRHYISIPGLKDSENDETKGHTPGTTRKMKQLMMKRFCYLFDIPYSDDGFDTDNIQGARARARVSQNTFTRQDGSTGINNAIELPRLPDEGDEA
jgi:hypothetical protein